MTGSMLSTTVTTPGPPGRFSAAWKPKKSPRLGRRHDGHGLGQAALPRGGAATDEAYRAGVDEVPRMSWGGAKSGRFTMEKE